MGCRRRGANRSTLTAAPAEAKFETLKQLREHIKHDPEGLEQFVKERSMTRGGQKLGESPEPEMKMKKSRDRDQEREL